MINIEMNDEDIEYILQQFINESLRLTNVEYVSKHVVRATIQSTNMMTLQRFVWKIQKEKSIKIIRVTGFIPLLNKFICRYEYVTALFVAIAFVMLCMNIIWKVEIQGVSEEVEYQFVQILADNQIAEGKWLPNTDNYAHIEQQLIKEIPALLFVRLKRNGNNFYIEAIEKSNIEKHTELHAKQYVASKSGMVKEIFVQSGIANVHVNDYVRKGDALIVGYRTNEEDEQQAVFDHVAGKIYAETWYELTLEQTIPTMYEKVTDTHYTKYALRIGGWTLPIPHYKEWTSQVQSREEISTHQLYFLKWKTPIRINKTIHWQVEQIDEENMQEAQLETLIDKGLSQFQNKMGNDVEILMYDVLYDTIEEDKMKVKLFVSLYENIAIPK